MIKLLSITILPDIMVCKLMDDDDDDDEVCEGYICMHCMFL